MRPSRLHNQASSDTNAQFLSNAIRACYQYRPLVSMACEQYCRSSEEAALTARQDDNNREFGMVSVRCWPSACHQTAHPWTVTMAELRMAKIIGTREAMAIFFQRGAEEHVK